MSRCCKIDRDERLVEWPEAHNIESLYFGDILLNAHILLQ